MPSYRPSSTFQYAFVATLGGKAQNFSFPLDCLLAQGLPVTRVFALHLAPTDIRVNRALNQLRADFEIHAPYRPIHFDSVVIRENPPDSLLALHNAIAGQAIDDVDHPAAPDAIWMTTHHLIHALQGAGYTVVLCVTGGPRLIGLQAVSVASLLFRQRDACYHLFTPRPLRDEAGEGRILHAPAESGVRLVEVPLLPMGMIAPGLQRAAQTSPKDIVETQRQWVDAEELSRCRSVLKQLTPRERATVRCFAAGGQTVASVAAELGLSHKTVNQYKTKVFEICRVAWKLPNDYRMTHPFLREKFGAWLGDSSLW
jgi:CRISPR-associated protein Csx14